MSTNSSNKTQPKKSSNSFQLLKGAMSEVEKKSGKAPVKKSLPDLRMKITGNAKEGNATSSKVVDKDPDIPDRSFGDLFCSICDSHMNSEYMWEQHVTGKRHIKNVKKGDPDSKYEDLDNVESDIKYELRNVKDTVVGLSHVVEIRRREPNVPPLYTCFLCQATIATVPLVIEHILSMKHRLFYIKNVEPDEYNLLQATNLKKGHMEPLVLEVAAKCEQKYGRGTVKVKQEKKKPAANFNRKFDDADAVEIDRYKPPCSNNNNNNSVWKSVDDFKKKEERYRRSRSPRDFKDKRRYSDDSDDSFYKRTKILRESSPPRKDFRRSPPKHSDHFHKKTYQSETLHKRREVEMSRKQSIPEKAHFSPSTRYDLPPSHSQRSPLRETYPTKNVSDGFQQVSYNTQDNLLPHEKTTSSNDLKETLVQHILDLPIDVLFHAVDFKLKALKGDNVPDMIILLKFADLYHTQVHPKLDPVVLNLLPKLCERRENEQKIPGLNDSIMKPPSAASFTSDSISAALRQFRQPAPSINASGPNKNIIQEILDGAGVSGSLYKSSQDNLYQTPLVHHNQSLYQNRNVIPSYMNPSTSIQYASTSAPNYPYSSTQTSSSIPGLSLSMGTAATEKQTYNYQHSHSIQHDTQKATSEPLAANYQQYNMNYQSRF